MRKFAQIVIALMGCRTLSVVTLSVALFAVDNAFHVSAIMSIRRGKRATILGGLAGVTTLAGLAGSGRRMTKRKQTARQRARFQFVKGLRCDYAFEYLNESCEVFDMMTTDVSGEPILDASAVGMWDHVYKSEPYYGYTMNDSGVAPIFRRDNYDHWERPQTRATLCKAAVRAALRVG